MNTFILTNLKTEEIDRFIERYNLPKFTQKEKDHLNRLLSIKEV
jgi:hypothetical protein